MGQLVHLLSGDNNAAQFHLQCEKYPNTFFQDCRSDFLVPHDYLK